MGDSIFEFADEFGIESPFGNWIENDFPNSNNKAYIISFTAENQENTYLKNNSINTDFVTYKISCKVVVYGYIHTTKINCLTLNKANTAYFSHIGNNYYSANTDFSLSIPKSKAHRNGYNSKEFLFKIEILDSKNKVQDSRHDKIMIDIYGNEQNQLTPKYIPNDECLCKKSYWTASELNYIVSEVRKNIGWILKSVFDTNNNPIYIDKKNNFHYNVSIEKAKKLGYEKYLVKTPLYYLDDDEDDRILYDRIFFYESGGYNIKPSEANYEKFADNINRIFQIYHINTCLRKIHFLAQTFHESSNFRTTYEKSPKSNYSGGEFYRGRGIKQITHDYNYLNYYSDLNKTNHFDLYIEKRLKEKFESVTDFNIRTKNKYISKETMNLVNSLAVKVSKEMFYAIDSAGWYWNKNNLNKFADLDDFKSISALVNNPSAKKDNKSTEDINGYESRKEFYIILKEIFNYENCH